MTSVGWLLDDDKKTFTMEDLKSFGVIFETVEEEKLTKFCQDLKIGIQNSFIDMTPENYETAMKGGFTEHFHDYDEIRYVMNGDCLFDIRDKNDQWIRIEFPNTTFFIIPSGCYHRFKGKENFLKLRK